MGIGAFFWKKKCSIVWKRRMMVVHMSGFSIYAKDYFWQKGCLSEMIQYRKQLLSCSQSSSSSLITEIENIFSSHIVIHFEPNPGMCWDYSFKVLSFTNICFTLQSKMCINHRSGGGRWQNRDLQVSSINISTLPSPGNTGPRHTWTSGNYNVEKKWIWQTWLLGNW